MNVIRNIFARFYAGIFLPVFRRILHDMTNSRRKKTRMSGFLSSVLLSLKQRESKIR